MLGSGTCQQKGMWADQGLTCTWCPTDVMCDISMRERVSELDMCPCCLCYDGGKRGTCSGSVVVAPFVHFCLFIFDGSLR